MKTHQRKLYDARNICTDVTNGGKASGAKASVESNQCTDNAIHMLDAMARSVLGTHCM
jgi:hypothetical protein